MKQHVNGVEAAKAVDFEDVRFSPANNAFQTQPTWRRAGKLLRLVLRTQPRPDAIVRIGERARSILVFERGER